MEHLPDQIRHNIQDIFLGRKVYISTPPHAENVDQNN